MKLRVSSSVLNFKAKAEKAWGLKPWDGIDDPDKEVLFFGLFHDRDFEVFHNFKGERSVFWCGGDILRLIRDYERKRVMKINPAKHYCENEQEAENLRKAGLDPIIIPSFLGEVEEYPVSFKAPEDGKWKIWMCGHERREQEYGFDQARELARVFPDVEFHFYGLEKQYEGKANLQGDNLPNIIYHGQVPEKQLDEEIRNYHAGLRGNEHDGMSEVIVKSVLLGQYPISRIPYEGVWSYEDFAGLVRLVEKLKQQKEPNPIRETWKQKLNTYPWCK